MSVLFVALLGFVNHDFLLCSFCILQRRFSLLAKS